MPYKDKEAQATYNRNYLKIYYQVNKKSERKRLALRKQELRKFITEYKNQFTCHYCSGIENLEFHHEDPNEKYMAISHMISNGHSKENILNEIKKCIVVCRPCHIKTHKKYH